MKNYTYIIASIPALGENPETFSGEVTPSIDWILSSLEGEDLRKAGLLLRSFEPDGPCQAFYEEALRSRSAYIKRYFTEELRLRSAKARSTNRFLGRPEGSDIPEIASTIPSDPIKQKEFDAILGGSDILAKEKALDAYLWKVSSEAVLLEGFTLDRILGILTKLCIIRRWLRLDRESGQAMFRSLLQEARTTYGKIDFSKI